MSVLQDLLGQARPPGSGPERSLYQAAIASRLPTDKRLPRLMFREPKLPTGYPDLVAVYPSRRTVDYLRARRDLTADHVKVMHFLYLTQGGRLDGIAQALAQPVRQLRDIIGLLEEAGMVRWRGSYVAPRALSGLFIARRIVAIELKVSDWAKAILQAHANTWFASHSYILIRPHRSIEAITQESRGLGVGVLVLEGDEVQTALHAAEHRIPGSYGSWILNEWALRRLSEEGGH